ncbi:MAG: tRNA dihydrouridine synthase DusB [Candidatus Dormibacteraeota bacterium]|nr:tRNA dihydrouridine synthase DusB [Candidatus Dormibacteraeota bacterium]MBV9525157.1 tRNA dihydrouridine synthase DusB [Candidatus Dormibacteraeota bacterium]
MAVATVSTGLRIGTLELSSRVLIAPMVGITDAPLRELVSELGAGLVSTEMVAAEAVVREVGAALELLDCRGGTSPVAAQLVGCDPQVMAAAARICVARGASLVDVNLGCPVPRVVNRGSGAALARDVAATARVLGAMVEAVSVPVTAKMRLGWDHHTINAPELARALQDVGVAAVTVHGRTRCQRYQGLADWSEIARVKESVDIPVIGSGDVDDVRVLRMRVRAGMVDGAVIARGMLGNLWFVHQAVQHLATGALIADQPFADRIALTERHLEMLCAYYGDTRALRIGRKYVAWTIKGCSGAARLRAEVQHMDTREHLRWILDQARAAGPAPTGHFQPVFTSGEG